VCASRAGQDLPSSTILEARELCSRIYMDEKLKDYILAIVFATRFPDKLGLSELIEPIRVGASPRATISLARASRANASIHHRRFRHSRGRESIAP